MKHTYATLSDRVDSHIYPRVSAFFTGNNTLSRFSFGDTIPDPFPVGDTIPDPFPVGGYPSCPGLLDDVERENRELKDCAVYSLKKRTSVCAERSNGLSAAHRQRILSYNA